jgi:hypothetical protein
VVEDPRSLVGHADLVCVGKGEGDSHVDLVPGLPHYIALNAQISGWFLDARQDIFKRPADLVRCWVVHKYAPLRAFKGVNVSEFSVISNQPPEG